MRAIVEHNVRRFRASTLARNTVWMFAGQGTGLIIQAGYFVVMARALGVKEYGAFVAVAALISLVAPMATLGFGNVLIKHVARDRRRFAECWGNALVVSAVSGAALVALILTCGRLILGNTVPLQLITAVALGDLFFASPLQLAIQAYQALEKLERTAQLQTVFNLSRLFGALLLVALPGRATAILWSEIYLAATALTSAMAAIMVHSSTGRPRFCRALIAAEWKEGIYFGLSTCARNTYNDIDKTMLARLAALRVAGVYGAAYRVIDVSFVPLRALALAAYPNFFRSGQYGLESTYSYAKRLLSKALIYAAVIALGTFACAGLVPRVLGADYRGAIEVIRWLSLMPVIKTVQYFLSDSLSGAGYQGRRTGIQIAVAFLNIAANLYAIPRWSWRGAIATSLLCDGLFALSVWLVIKSMLWRAAKLPAQPAEAACS